MQSKRQLRQKLSTLKFTDNEDRQKQFIELEANYLELAIPGYPVTEKERTAALLRTLPNSLMWITILADVTNMEDDQLVSLVRSEIDRRIQRASTSSLATKVTSNNSIPPYSAAKMSTLRGKQTSRWTKKGVQCWKCRRIGHIRSEPWSRKQNHTKDGEHKANWSFQWNMKNHEERKKTQWEAVIRTVAHDKQIKIITTARKWCLPRFRCHSKYMSLLLWQLPNWLDSGASHVFFKEKDLYWDY